MSSHFRRKGHRVSDPWDPRSRNIGRRLRAPGRPPVAGGLLRRSQQPCLGDVAHQQRADPHTRSSARGARVHRVASHQPSLDNGDAPAGAKIPRNGVRLSRASGFQTAGDHDWPNGFPRVRHQLSAVAQSVRFAGDQPRCRARGRRAQRVPKRIRRAHAACRGVPNSPPARVVPPPRGRRGVRRGGRRRGVHD
jgi:hypothetical protein